MNPRRNGFATAHGREWLLYERWESGKMVLFMSPEDEASKFDLDRNALQQHLRYRRKGAYEYYGGLHTSAVGEVAGL